MTGVFRALACVSPILIATATGCTPHAVDETSADAPDFRQARWGMTPDDVRVTERAEPKSRTADRLQYNGRVYEERAGITYAFTDGKLSEAWYTLFCRYGDEIPTFRRLERTLTEEYGEPVTHEVVWGSDVADADELRAALEANPRGYKDVTWQPWSVRIAAGDLTLTAEWVLDETRIRLRLYGNDDVVIFRLIYESRAQP